jgi:hypothetical protein
MIIYWLSQHEPLPSQREELQRLFGDHRMVVDKKPFGSAEEIISRIRNAQAAECVVVAPLSVIGRLVDLGLRPLWAEMKHVQRLTDPIRQTVAKGRVYEFVDFRRVVRLELIKEPIAPISPTSG